MRPSQLDGGDWIYRPHQPIALGCFGCHLLPVCGGLRVDGAAIDCQRFCCGKSNCEMVCFNAPRLYAKRLREIGGLTLDNIPRCEPVPFERMKGYVPLLHHAYSRSAEFPGHIVSLSLFELIDRDCRPKYCSREEISKAFRILVDAKLVISGVHQDDLVERVWQSAHRAELISFLKACDISLLTCPNFSVYNNVPRTENLYNIKRIGLLSQEFLSAGLPTALHINACTDRDYERYTEFLVQRHEYQSISFEFITGARSPERMAWHVSKLNSVARHVQRPLQLVLRGGTNALHSLSAHFENILILDSDPLHKALHRQRMTFGNAGRISVSKNKLPKGFPVDELLIQNVEAASKEVDFAIHRPRRKTQSSLIANRSGLAKDTNNEAGQLELLPQTGGGESRANTIDRKRVIAAAKTKRAAEV